MLETLGLIKFGAREHIERFVNEGEMYFQTVEHFQKLEADELRGDPSEGLSEYHQAPLVELIFTSHETGRRFEFSGKKGTLINAVRISTNYATGLHVFCMYAVAPGRNPLSLYVDPRCGRFGDAYCIIADAGAFFEKLDAAISATTINGASPWAKRDLVEYIDPNIHSGGMGPFRKFHQFEWQSEYRIAIATGRPDPWTLKIGSLKGIAEIGDPPGINAALTLGYNLLPPRSGTGA